MPRSLFSLSSARKSRSPSRPEHVSSSSPMQETSLSPPLDNASLSDADESFLNLPLPTWSAPSMKSTSDISFTEKKRAWNPIPRMMRKKDSRTQGSTGAGSASLERPPTPDTTTVHETQLHVSPPPSPTANPSTSRLWRPESKNKSRLPSDPRERKTSEPVDKIEAFEGELVASRHKIGTASIDCEFFKIEYGQFMERPACLIIVDVRLVYPPDNTIDRAQIEFQFAKDDEQNLAPENHNSTQITKAPISKVFAPEIVEGMPSDSKKTIHHNIKPKIEGLSFKIDTGGGGGQTTTIKQHRWRVLGRREEHNGIYDTFGWNIFQNEASEDSVPRQVRLGMIAFHQHQPFCVNVSIKGSTRQKHRRTKATRGKRWFNPPNTEDVGRHILQEAMVENLVTKQNLLIRDIAPNRLMEGTTINLIDIAEFSGGAGAMNDGGGMITDLLSSGDVALTVDSPTSAMDYSNMCN